MRLRPNQASAPLSSNDFNGDGNVSFQDFFILASGFGSADPVLDLDQDGRVGSGDVALLKRDFGEKRLSKLALSAETTVAEGSDLAVSALSISSQQVLVQLKLSGISELTGYGVGLHFDPAVLSYIAQVDSAGLPVPEEARVGLIHEGGAGYFALADHLRGRQSVIDLESELDIGLLFAVQGTRRDVEIVVEEGFVGRGAGRAWRAATLGRSKVMPSSYALFANYPNPFNPTTTLPFALPEIISQDVTTSPMLTLYNILGQPVRRWSLGGLAPGYHVAEWDGLDAHGRPSGSGVYQVRLTAGRFDQSRKLLLLR